MQEQEDSSINLSDFPISENPLSLPFSLPLLCKRDNRGKELFWQIGASGSDSNISIGTIFIEHGYIDGETKYESREISPVGKKTLLEQTLQECRSRRHLKIQEGYHPVNSNSEIIHLETMQAHKYTPTTKLKFPVYLQVKEDGIFCKVYKHNDKVCLVSRKNNHFYHMNHIREELYNIIGDAVLNGELCIPGKGFQDITSVVKSQQNTDQKNEVVLKLFDIVAALGYQERYKLLEQYVTKSVQIIETTEANNKNDIEAYFQQVTNRGYEGIVIRILGEPYQHGRSKNLLKYKKQIDDEAEIIEVREGSGRDQGCAIFRLRIDDDIEFNVVAPGGLDERRKIYQNREQYIGKKCAYVCQELTKKGVPRFPKCKAIRDYE